MITSLFRRRVTAAVSTVVAGVGVLTAGATLAAAPAGAYPSCAVPVFETDGYKNGLSLPAFAAFNRAVPAGYQAAPVTYQDGVFPVVDPLALDASVAGGIRALDGAVRAFHTQCPGTRIIISGFSEGALVAGGEIENLSRTNVIPHNLIDGVLYGDPRRPFGDGGVGGVAGGIETNLPTLVPGVTMRGPHHFGDVAVRELCHENDGICNSTNLITNAAAFANGIAGYLPINGFSYHGYSIDPVRDQGNGLVFRHDPIQRVPFGPPIATGVGTPWQIADNIFGPAAGIAAYRSAIGPALALIPQPIKDALADDPWFRLINS